LTTAERVEALTARIDPFDANKIRLIKELIAQNIDLDLMWKQ
jgi:BioD-like phosphotransacetylase family protein